MADHVLVLNNAGETIRYASSMTAAALADAIAGLLADPAAARALGAAAVSRFDERIGWERAGGPRLVAAYGRLLGSPGGA